MYDRGKSKRGEGIAIILLAAALIALPISAQAQPAPRYAVVLDAAHGGDDTGGHAENWSEKSFTLALSVRLRSQLGARGITVVTTRETDAAVEPERRAQIANHANAQACLSLHASLTGTGVHLFASSLAPARPAQFTPWKTAQAAFVNRSLALAGTLNSALTHAGMTVTLARAGLPVIDSLACPAVDIEVSPEPGSTESPADSLSDSSYQAKVAEAVVAAIVEWRAEGSSVGDAQP